MELKDRTLALNEYFFIECFRGAGENLEKDALVTRRKQAGSLHKELKGVFPL